MNILLRRLFKRRLYIRASYLTSEGQHGNIWASFIPSTRHGFVTAKALIEAQVKTSITLLDYQEISKSEHDALAEYNAASQGQVPGKRSMFTSGAAE